MNEKQGEPGRWFVWYTEYPDEGSVVVTASRRSVALKRGAHLLGVTEDEPAELSCARARPKDILVWEKAE